MDRAPLASSLSPVSAGSTIDPLAAWRAPLMRVTVALSAFLVATGLFIYLAPFSATAQYAVLAHTLLGLGFIFPYAAYQVRHLRQVWRHPLWYVAVTGYAGGAVLAVTCVSGVALTVECLFGTRASPLWDFSHTAFGLAASLILVLHVVEAAVFRGRIARRYGTVREPTERGTIRGEAAGGDTTRRDALRPDAPDGPLASAAGRAAVRTGWIAFGGTAGLGILCVIPALVYSGVRIDGELPPDYGFKYGPNPFAPSLAMTSTGGALNPHALSGSKYCGDSGCHEEIVREWEPSAHRYASRSKFFQIIQKTMAENNGAESTRYCAGCHDPIALFSGAKNIYEEDLSSLGADEGVSCVGCHSIVKTDVKGNANYVIDPPRRYLFEESGNPLARRVAGFLIRAYPRQHAAGFSRDLLKTPEFCGACHKQFIDEEINRVGWVQLQNQFDNWRKSHWYRPSATNPDEADPARTITCRECHMRLTDSGDPAAGDFQDYNRSPRDGKHRDHRFIGANQWLPKLHDLPGADEQVRLTEEWLRGETEIPEIADKWAGGPAVPLEIVAPRQVAPGERVSLRVVVTSNKVGHDFPTGPLDIIQSWVELKVLDGTGVVVFESGTVDDRNFIQDGTFVFKAEGIDAAGNLIDRHNLWDMVGARFRRSLFPGFADTAEYEFVCPSAVAKAAPLAPEREYSFAAPAGSLGALTVKARLRYRKVDQTLIDFVAPGSGLTAPITDMSFAEAKIAISSIERTGSEDRE